MSDNTTSGDKKASFNKSNGFKQGEKKPYGRDSRPVSGKPAYGKPAGKPAYGRPAGDKPAYGRPAGDKPAYGRPAGDKPAYGRPAGDKPAYGRPAGDKPAYGRPAGDKPAYGRPAGDKPAYGRPAGDKPAYGRPAGDKPAFSRISGDKPAFSRPAGDKPAFSRPSGDRPAFSRPSAPRKREETSTLGARRVALDTLLDIKNQDSYASLALDKRLSGPLFLSDRDKRLCTELVYGTVENRIRLDYMIDQFLENKDIEHTVREIIRIGAYQLFFLDRVPDMAAVDESVKLTRSMGLESLTGLVNGVLRNMIRGKADIHYPSPKEEPVRYLSIMFSMPEYLTQRLIDTYGEAEALAIARYKPKDHDTTIRLTKGKKSPADFEVYLAKHELTYRKAMLENVYKLERPGDLAELPGFKNGLFSIQGESSVLAARVLGVSRGMNVLDVCAAPGGKTAVLAEEMQGTGRVQAWDLHEHRVALIRAMAKRLYLDNVRPVMRDATIHREDLDFTMDAVLIDAPCSGTGVIVSKPDVKYRVNAQGVSELVLTQAAILDACCNYVKPGGTLVYSTCSILPEENKQQVIAFLEKHTEFELSDLTPYLPEQLHERIEDGMLQLLAHRDGMEGFFISRMVRKKR